ncbi:hypothetical protein CQW23_22639 [Capsicum baccatum]|uniref:RWP-RK domain-containing protein n=1 Tax=Capsicum baccatum TaxID=33114 RepID=A0A2G2W1G1_CAPBA|nr:hypothetical protein CQW23_22639 [Capsicum baccatum]
MLLRDEEEVELGQMELEISNSMVNPLISSPGSTCWQIEQLWEPDNMLYFDYSLLPASPMEDFTLWNHSWSPPPPPHHDHQESARMKRAEYIAPLDLLSVEALKKAIEEFMRFRKEHRKQKSIIDVRFEEKAYTAGTSQVSLSMLSMETKSENPVCGKPVQIVDESPKFQCMQLDAKSPAEESPLHVVPSWGDCALPVSFQQRSITEHVNLKRKVDTGPSGQGVTIFELCNKQKMNKKYKKTWRIGDSVSLEDLKEQFGKKREEAAESLNVSISTFKRICRERGISRWPSSKIKRERLLLSSLSCNGTDRVAANTQMHVTTGLTALASTYSVKSNQQKEQSLNLSVNIENGTSSNGTLLEKYEDGDRENIMIQVEDSANQELEYIPQEFQPACDSLIPDVPTILHRLPQERTPAEDATSSAPGQQGEHIARQIEMTSEISQLEKQHLGKESFKCDSRNVSEPIQGHAIVDSTQMEVQPFLESVSTRPFNSFSCNENTVKNTKLLFDDLIALPLKDLIDPDNETSMKKTLSILADNLSLFSEEQAKQILELSVYFPTLVHNWREFSRSQMYNQKSLAETGRIIDLAETSVKDEESLNVRYEELKRKEQELRAQLEAVQKEKAGIAEQRNEKSKQTKHLVSLAEEKAASSTKEKHMMKIATTKLNNLVDQWAKIQSFFIYFC